jgi:rhodanese-related sulfurtransferase
MPRKRNKLRAKIGMAMNYDFFFQDKKNDYKKIYIHCRSGKRVREAQKILAKYGCTEFNVIPITMMQMIEEGFSLTS